ncbi:MAG TPA: hypothetical protein VFD74_05085 [Thermoleophilia bacterium]|nr:hypothetical protein [Thermoleophilia bacterium]
MESLHPMSARQIVQLVRSREVSPVEVVTATLERIEGANPVLNASVAVDAEGALS